MNVILFGKKNEVYIFALVVTCVSLSNALSTRDTAIPYTFEHELHTLCILQGEEVGFF